MNIIIVAILEAGLSPSLSRIMFINCHTNSGTAAFNKLMGLKLTVRARSCKRVKNSGDLRNNLQKPNHTYAE